jgi:TPP-dependent pyruvate/acetoin dehydrogenase alpha subunit
VKRILNDALQRAESSPPPDPSQLLEGVYAEADELDQPHLT